MCRAIRNGDVKETALTLGDQSLLGTQRSTQMMTGECAQCVCRRAHLGVPEQALGAKGCERLDMILRGWQPLGEREG